ncbi:MAG: hypothetical protein E7218_08660 [Anaerofustis stercorihominis]|nr:hypothetical protein [Anaerofustis stercorihominis]
MSESKIELKDIYDDAILQGCTDGANITRICDAKLRVDHSTELTVRALACGLADRLAGMLNGDPKVAYVIASILYTSTILYGKIGEEFLRGKMRETGEDFSQEEYSLAVAESVLKNYNGNRKQKVTEGVIAALSDKDNKEANAAKAGIVKHDLIWQVNMEMVEELDEAYLNGEIIKIQTLQETIMRTKYGDIDESSALENLNIIYHYLKQNIHKIVPVYREIYPEISEEKLLVYYIARLGYEEVARVKALAATAE